MKNKNEKHISELLDDTVSAHEQTGALQRIEIDPKELKLFHSKYNDKT